MSRLRRVRPGAPVEAASDAIESHEAPADVEKYQQDLTAHDEQTAERKAQAGHDPGCEDAHDDRLVPGQALRGGRMGPDEKNRRADDRRHDHDDDAERDAAAGDPRRESGFMGQL